jgi:ABC-type lipoprotein release transport system permease subunit
MKTYLKMAWRNLWRNKVRTLITVSAISLFVMLSAVMTSTQYGSYDQMVNTFVKFSSGYLQIHHEDYWGSKDLNNSIVFEARDTERYAALPAVKMCTPRLESFALAATDNSSRGIAIMGIEPQSEDAISDLSSKITEGSYIRTNDQGILIGDELARYLDISIGDTLSLISVGYQASSAEMNFPVQGIMHFPIAEQNKRMVYMPLLLAQEYFSAPDLVTSLVIMVNDHPEVEQARTQIQAILPNGQSVMSWDEMQPELVQSIESDKAGGVVMKFILYVIIAFGLYATILMMMSERRREFGMMISVGMQRRRLGWVVFTETVMISLLGAFIGIILSAIVVQILYLNPIPLQGETAHVMEEFGIEPYIYFSNHSKIFGFQALWVGAIAFIIGLFPLRWIRKLNIIEALRS